MKKAIIWIIIIIIIGFGIYYFTKGPSTTVDDTGGQAATTTTTDQTATSTDQGMMQAKPEETIGISAGGRDIMAYHYGTGDKEVLFVGGIHGGYEWNTSLLAYQFMDYLKANPDAVPSNEKVTVIPVVNPDGLSKVVSTDGKFSASDVSTSSSARIAGRFNANDVDLNRNFDCDWQAQGVWQTTPVSGGESAFSEPEARAIKNYVGTHNITAAVVFYSSAGGVFSSNCHGGVLTETTTLTDLYASASGYKPYESFDFYKITGDMVNWLAKENIPAISVLLTDHENTEWSKNIAGIKAVLDHYAN